jgi:hypothetical protein
MEMLQTAQLGRISQVALVIMNRPANAGDIREVGLIPGSESSTVGGYGNPLQYSSLENSMGRGAWQSTVHGVAKRVGHELATKQQLLHLFS